MEIWARSISAVYENLLHSCSSAEVQVRKMSEQHSASYAASGSGGSSQGSSWQERRYKRNEN